LLPEQALGKPLDARSDLFSLGLTIYEMATAKQAFSGSTSAATLDAILHETPPRVTELNPSLPAELDQTISRLLEKDASLRYQTAADLSADLKRVQRNLTSGHSTMRVAPTSLTQEKQGRNRWISATVRVVVLAGVASLGWRYLFAPRKYIGPAARLVPFTTYPGDKGYPAFAPDGNERAFIWQGENPKDPSVYNIYAQLVGAGSPLRLTAALAQM
jgi:hypothetical protein